MFLDHDYIARYRSIPAASHREELTENVIPYLPCCSDLPDFYISTPMHYHPEAEILYIAAGEWKYLSANTGQYRSAAAGDILFFSPYEPHETALRAGSKTYTTQCICFDVNLLACVPGDSGADLAHALTDGFCHFPAHITNKDTSHALIHHAFETMLCALDAPEHCEEFLFFGALCTMVGILKREGFLLQKDSSATRSKKNDLAEQHFARRVIDYTETHYAENLSTSSAAAAMNYSESYFCRMFRRVFQMCYSDYVNRIRIAKARPLLETMSVTDAATACGFSHMSLFAKTFRRCTGMSPTEYQNLTKR